MEEKNSNNQKNITNDGTVLEKMRNLSKIFIIIAFVFSVICIVIGIVARITKIEVLGTVCAIIGVLGVFISIGLLGFAFSNKSDYCPVCGARIRKTQTFLRRIEGNRSDTTSGYTIPYINYYHCTSDCALCGWEKEYEKRENAGKLFYSNSNGRLQDSVKNPKADFDTGYPDNSDLELLEPETRLKKVKILTRTLIIISILLLVTSMFAMSSSAAVEADDNSSEGDSSITDNGNSSLDDLIGENSNNDISNNNGSNSDDNTTPNQPVIVYEVDESEWESAFGYNKLSNVTLTNYCDNEVYAIMIVDDGYISVEEFDEYGNRTAYAAGAITNAEIEETIGLGLKNLYSYFTYNADIQSYEYNGCYVQFSNGVLTSITQMYEGAEYRLEYTNYGTSEVS